MGNFQDIYLRMDLLYVLRDDVPVVHERRIELVFNELIYGPTVPRPVLHLAGLAPPRVRRDGSRMRRRYQAEHDEHDSYDLWKRSPDDRF